MGNISYDSSKRIRSAAGTSRTTPGIPGTSSNPRGNPGFRYGETPSTPPASTSPTPHLSKAAGGKGAGVGGSKPAWLQNTQSRFQSMIDYKNTQSRQAESRPPSPAYGVGPEARQMSQVGPGARQMNQAAPPPSDPRYTVTTPGPMPYQNNTAALSAPEAGINSARDFQQMLQNPQMQASFQQWLQQQFQQGLL